MDYPSLSGKKMLVCGKGKIFSSYWHHLSGTWFIISRWVADDCDADVTSFVSIGRARLVVRVDGDKGVTTHFNCKRGNWSSYYQSYTFFYLLFTNWLFGFNNVCHLFNNWSYIQQCLIDNKQFFVTNKQSSISFQQCFSIKQTPFAFNKVS